MLRRLLECRLVSVYSSGSINLLHYGLGYGFYCCVVWSLLLRLPGEISLAQAIAHSAVHALLAWGQFKAAQTLAALRKDGKGAVIHRKHLLPQGHLFRYLSSPHYNLEMLIYLNLFCLVSGSGGGGGGLLFHLLLFVLVNQSASALLSHAWYRRQFGSSFPADRRALIPFVL
uniref:Polyprenal reductase n=1 Tax=Macrostomum lignano TaxID=282301 RepID=A0A1I8I5F1_9PLAT